MSATKTIHGFLQGQEIGLALMEYLARRKAPELCYSGREFRGRFTIYWTPTGMQARVELELEKEEWES